jgi:predicted alpha/beta hydrolase family esterase
MASAPRAARATLRVLSRVAPPVAAEIGFRLWRSLGAPEPVHARDRDVHERAKRGVLEIDGFRVATYSWGSGPEIILLVHGWRSRASRFSSVVRALEAPTRTIVAFDVPGNGDSTGRRTTVLDYAHIIRRLGARYGGFDTIVAHSFGVLAAFLAVREGVPTRRIAGIAGVHDAHQIVDEFSRQAGLTGRAKAGLRSRVERRTFPHVADPWRRFVAELDPADTATAVLLVHDRNDPVVDAAQATLIAEAHNGPVRVILTDGLGHARVVSDPAVLDAIERFADGAWEPVIADRH